MGGKGREKAEREKVGRGSGRGGEREGWRDKVGRGTGRGGEREGWTMEWEGRGERRLNKEVGGEGREKVGQGSGRGGDRRLDK